MKRKFGLIFATILTLGILWFGTTGSAWASPASGTVPPGTGPYRVLAVKAVNQGVYTLYTPKGIKPAGLKYLLKGALMYVYKKSNGLRIGGNAARICGIIKPGQVGQMYKLTNVKGKLTWLPLPSTITKTTPKKVCTKNAVSAGKYVVLGK